MIAPMANASLLAHVFGEGVKLGNLRHCAMDRGVEAGHLRKPRERLRDRAGASNIIRLMRRRHRTAIEVVEHVAFDQHRFLEALSSEHDAMADRRDLTPGIFFPIQVSVLQGLAVVDRMAFAPFMRRERLARLVFHHEVGVRLHAVDHAPAEDIERAAALGVIDGEFQVVEPEFTTTIPVVMAAYSEISGLMMDGSFAAAFA